MSNVPYPGLRPFGRKESNLFFGRDEHVDQLLDKLHQTRFVAVFGPSGFGKSSLVRAGLFPALEAGFVAGAGSRWHIAEMRPGNQPFLRTAQALVEQKVLGDPQELFSEQSLTETSVEFQKSIVKIPAYGSPSSPLKKKGELQGIPLAPFEKKGELQENIFLEHCRSIQAVLQRGSLGLKELLDQIPLPNNTNLLLLVDQFEEIFRYHQEGGKEETKAFVDFLLESAKQQDQPIYIVITMRSDFLSDCTQFLGLPEAINDGQFLTPRLTREQFQEAIEGPARIFQGNVEPELCARLLNDAGTHLDQLPLMQHVLMRIWHRTPLREASDQGKVLTPLVYEEMGGFGQVLSQHADEGLESLSAPQKIIAEQVFRALCERGSDQRDTRHPMRLGKILEILEISQTELEAVLEPFRTPERSFITPALPQVLTKDTILDISHESLIRQWKTLQKWVVQEAQSADIYLRLEKTTLLWQDGQAGLWGDPDLKQALQWQATEKPNKAWAERYGSHFDLALEFLQASQTAEEERQKAEAEAQRQKAEAEAQQRKLARFRQAMGWGGSAFIVVFGLMVWAIIAQNKAEVAEQKRTRQLFESQLTHASLLAKGEDYAQAKTILKQSRQLDSSIPATRQHSRNLLSWFTHLMSSSPEKSYEGAEAVLLNVEISPDGRWLAAAGERGILVLFNRESGKLLKRVNGHRENHIGALVFHPQGDWLASGGDDQRILFWSLPEGEKIDEWQAPGEVWSLAISSDGKQLASGGRDKNITLWDVKTGKKLKTLGGHKRAIGFINGLAFHPVGHLLGSVSYDGTAQIWNVETGESEVLKGHAGELIGIVFSPSGNLVATSSVDQTIRLWNVESKETIKVLRGHQNMVFSLVFGQSGERLISTGLDRTLRIWDTESGVILHVLQGHTARVLDITRYQEKWYSVSNDGTVKRWQDGSQKYLHILDLKEELVSVAIAPDGSSVAVGFANGDLLLYSLLEKKMLWRKNKAHVGKIQRLAFSSDGEWLASADFSDYIVKLWDVKEGKELQTLEGHESVIHDVAFSPDGQIVATASYDGQIGLFPWENGEPQFFEAHDGYVNSVVFNNRGTHLLSSGTDGTTKIWDLTGAHPKLLQTVAQSQDTVMWAALSPDEQLVVSVGRDHLVHLSSLKTDQEQDLVGHENTVFRAIFSPDSRQLATVSTDATVRLWDLETKRELFTLLLPIEIGFSSPLWDFDFRCAALPEGKVGRCWIVVPLTSGRLVVYDLGEPYR